MMLTTVFALGLAIGPSPATATVTAAATTATAAGDARYEPWLGCWDLEIDRRAGRIAPTRLCLLPADEGGVRILTISGPTVASTESLVVDGKAHPVSAPDCRGTEQTDWATTLPGFFRSGTVTCGSDTAARRVSSLAFLRTDGAWIDVQAATVGAQTSIRIRRFRRSTDQSLPPGAANRNQAYAAPRRERSAPWTAANVIEVSGKLPTEGVEAVITELDRPIELKKKQLLAMADGGVDERVIDLLVGLTYPEKFVVRSRGGGGSFGGFSGIGGFGAFDGFSTFSDLCDPMDVSRPGSCFDGLYDFGLWGYGLYGRNPYSAYRNRAGLYGYGPGWYGSWYSPYGGYVEASPSQPVVNPGRPVAAGVVINGQGYTRVTPREPTAVTGRFGGGTAGDASTSGGAANSGSVSSSGYSGSGSSGERTAVPRPPQ